MEWTVEQRPDFVVVTTQGPFDVNDHRRMVEDIVSRDFWHPGLSVFFDHRLLDFGWSGFSAIRQAVENHSANDERIGDGKAAILMKSLADYGRGRQFELLTEGQVGAKLRIFRDESEALRWLRE